MHVAAVAASDPICVKTNVLRSAQQSEQRAECAPKETTPSELCPPRDILGSFGDHMKISSTSLTARAFTRSVWVSIAIK